MRKTWRAEMAEHEETAIDAAHVSDDMHRNDQRRKKMGRWFDNVFIDLVNH